jgi:phosphomannomutase
LCRHYGLDVQRVKIGFKEICNVMLKEKVLVGRRGVRRNIGSSHMPDRDGIWMGFLYGSLWLKQEKTCSELIEEVYSITGSFAFERSDLYKLKNKGKAV